MNIDKDEYSGDKGTYISVSPSSASIDIIKSHIENDQPGVFDLDKFSHDAHMTILYSRKESIDTDKFLNMGVSDFYALPLKFEFWDGHDNEGYLVLKMKSVGAEELNQQAISAGGKHSFDDYTPHMTIEYGLNSRGFDKSIVDDMNAHISKYAMLIHFTGLKIDNIKKFEKE